MKEVAILTTILAAGLAPAAAHAQSPANPYTYTCSAYVASNQGQERGQANAMLYWATGYLHARLAPLPTTNFSAETFGRNMLDVHDALMRLCPNIPNMVVAEFMDNLAGDFEKSAKPLQ
jgi:hypothetical protein